MPLSRRIFAASPLVPLLLLGTTPAGATYSIAATDQATQQVGGAVTSCVGSQGVTIVYGAAPGFGAINAQASVVSTANRDEGVQLLQMGVAPASVLQQLNASDTGSASRQYGVVDLQGRVAGFTGSACSDYADHVTGTLGSLEPEVRGKAEQRAALAHQGPAETPAPGEPVPGALRASVTVAKMQQLPTARRVKRAAPVLQGLADRPAWRPEV